MFIVGIDSHMDTLAAAKCDRTGTVLGTITVPNTNRGWQELWKWARPARLWAIEGAGAYGAALVRFLASRQTDLREVPTRLTVTERWRMGRRKADEVDAIAAARAALREDLPPVIYNPETEALRLVVSHRRALVAEQTRTLNRLRRLLAVLDPPRTANLGRLRSAATLRQLQRLRTSNDPHRRALAALIRTHAGTALRRRAEITAATQQLRELLPEAGWRLTTIQGIAVITAADLLTQIKDIRRFPTAAAFTTWCGTAPLDASSGRQQHHRLNRFGNRSVNSMLHLAVLTQARHNPNHYIHRRHQTGKPKTYAIRAAKRYLARHIYKTLTTPQLT